MPAYKLIQGDCIEVMAQAKAESIDSIVCDPPYQIDFMGLEFDSPRMLGTARGLSGGFQKYPPGVKRPAVKDGNPLRFQEWCTAWGTEALRVMKTGAYGLAFGSDRTYHRLASGLEDAGFVIRGTMMYVHGQGMPKGQNVSKAIDKMLGAERGDGGRGSANCAYLDRGEECRCGDRGEVALSSGTIHVRATTSTSDEAKQWDGWNSQLKPALEPIVLFQKPFKGSIAKNVLAHGVGALNIDGCRIVPESGDYAHVGDDNRSDSSHVYGEWSNPGQKIPPNDKGRYPSNLILDDAAAELLDAQSGGASRFFKIVGGDQRCENHVDTNASNADSSNIPITQVSENVSVLTHAEENQESKTLRGASIVGSTECSEAGIDSAQGNASQIASLLGSICPEPITPETPRKSSSSAEIDTRTTLSTDQKPSQEYRHGSITQNKSHVNDVDRSERIGITTTTASRSTSDGSAEGATSPNMSKNSDHGDQDFASEAIRFKYHAKPSKAEKLAGVPEDLPKRMHETTKGIDLMRYLARLVTPPNGTILDCFLGSGTTGCAAMLEGFRFVGVEQSPEYMLIAEARMKYWNAVAEGQS